MELKCSYTQAFYITWSKSVTYKKFAEPLIFPSNGLAHIGTYMFILAQNKFFLCIDQHNICALPAQLKVTFLYMK